MIIKASIPVEKIIGTGSYTYRHEMRELEVVKVFRSPISYHNRGLNRWHYQALVKPCADLLAECSYRDDGLYPVNIKRRGLNDKWVPPVFPAGVDVFIVETLEA